MNESVTLMLEVTLDRAVMERLVRLAAQQEQSTDDFVADLLEEALQDNTSSHPIRSKGHHEHANPTPRSE
jgi:hypothetical protein